MDQTEYAQAIRPNTRWQNVIIVTSVLIPVVVAILIYLPDTARIADFDVSFLPHLNAALNSATALCLALSLWAILTQRVQTHKLANMTAFVLSATFLISYVIYHYAATHTLYGDLNHDGLLSDTEKAAAGSMRTIYFLLLISHILLAAAVVPLVLFSMYYSLSAQFAKHKKLSRYTWPVWFYVAVTGVIVYAMISPFYKS